MSSTVIVALISFAGTFIGTAGGIIASSKLTEYRLNQLEKKVDSFSKSVSRLLVIEEKIINLNRRVAKVENERVNAHSYFDGC